MKEASCNYAVTRVKDRTDDGRRAACGELKAELPRCQRVLRGWEHDLIIGNCQGDDVIAAPVSG
jgi:hypothetical protein